MCIYSVVSWEFLSRVIFKKSLMLACAFVLIHILKLQKKQNLGTVLCIILFKFVHFLCVFRFSIMMMVSANPCEMTVTQKMTVAAITMMKTMTLRMKRRCPKKNWSGTIQSKELQKKSNIFIERTWYFWVFSFRN